jgi:hypothetical protein
MKKLFLLLISLSFTPLITAQYNFDTLSHVQVGMGIFHTEILEPTMPWTIDVLEVDLTVPFNSIETVKANDRLVGLEKTSSMASRKNFPGHIIVGAVNGDFYGSGGVPTNTQVVKGEVLKKPISREIIGFDLNDKPIIEIVTYSGRLINRDTSIAISDLNSLRGNNQLILYNSFKGSNTGTNQYGTEISAEPIDTWYANDTIRVIVKNKVAGVGNMAIQNNRIVLSAHGTSTGFLDILNVGDTVKVVNKLIPGLNKLKEVIGGSERIIQDGINVGGWPEKHPRTAAGFSQDSTKLFLVTVDGRQSTSAGMTLTEMGAFMLQLGIYQAINLDGGGSTTMVVRDNIVNSPSDGAGERSVSNALLVVSSAPVGSLYRIKLTPEFQKLYHGETAQFSVKGWDEYYNPINLDPAQIHYSLSSGFGTITQSGLFTAGTEPDTGFVIVEYNGLKDSSTIVVKTITNIYLYPENAITDTVRKITFKTTAYDADGVVQQVPANAYQWNSSDETVGFVDSTGKFTGKKEGSTIITVSYRNLTDSSVINVVISDGIEQIDMLDSLTGWIIETENMDTPSTNVSVSTDTFTLGNASFKIDYQFTYNPSKLNWLHLKKDYPLSGVPEFLWIDAKSNGEKHHISYILSDDNNELFWLNTNKFAELNYFDSMKAIFSNIAPVVQGSFFNYPVILKQISIKFGSSKIAGQQYSGTVYIDNLRISYPSSVTSVDDFENYPNDFMLYQNYPNPFNPETKIKFKINNEGFVKLKIYDLLGREVASLINDNLQPGEYIKTWNASELTSGIYFCNISFEGKHLSRKMILLK